MFALINSYQLYVIIRKVKVNVKLKCTLSLIWTLDGVGGQRYAPAA